MNALQSMSQPNVLRQPPHNLEAERALLGAVLLNNKAYDRVADYLLPEHFADPVNARVYHVAMTLIESGRPANPVTLRTPIENDDIVKQAGGPKYLTALCNSVVTVVNAGDYGKLIHDLYLKRELITLGEDMVNGAFDSDLEETASDLVDRAEERLFALRTGRESQDHTVSARGAAAQAYASAEAAYKNEGALTGVTTGLIDVDARLGGLHPTDLIILAGRPSMGKSALGLGTAYAAAKKFKAEGNKQVALFSLEMGVEQLGNRFLAHLSGIDAHRIRTGRLSQSDMERLLRAEQALDGVPLEFDERAALTMAQIRAKCRRMSRKGLGLIVIDYLQLISPAGRGREENRVQEVSAITRGLKALAKDLNVPVLALSQLSRAVEQREDKRPQLSDLRESGTIEQDADVVMFIFREEYYLERSEPNASDTDKWSKWRTRMQAAQGVAELNIAKQRHGPVGTVRLHFNASQTWFSDLARTEGPERYWDR